MNKHTLAITRSVGVIGATAVLILGATYAAILGTVSLTGNTFSATTGLQISKTGSSAGYASTATGFNFGGLVPGGSASEKNSFWLKNTSGEAVTVSVAAAGTGTVTSSPSASPSASPTVSPTPSTSPTVSPSPSASPVAGNGTFNGVASDKVIVHIVKGDGTTGTAMTATLAALTDNDATNDITLEDPGAAGSKYTIWLTLASDASVDNQASMDASFDLNFTANSVATSDTDETQVH